MRICSLLPSATEIVCSLGLADDLAAITHECDYPPEIARLPPVTSSVVDSTNMSSAEIDAAIRRSLENLSTIYYLDRDLLAKLQPDLILTQELCEVCAVSFDRVQEAAHSACPGARILSLEPHSLSGILDNIREVAEATGDGTRADELLASLQTRVATLQQGATVSEKRPRTLTLEWLDPVFIGGHWVPEMVELAGGVDVLGRAGERSRQVEWSEVSAGGPEVVVLMPCGFNLERTVEEFRRQSLPSDWHSLPAVKNSQVYAVDGSSYFNRPGPRIVDGLEILARIIHPEIFGRTLEGEAIRLQ